MQVGDDYYYDANRSSRGTGKQVTVTLKKSGSSAHTIYGLLKVFTDPDVEEGSSDSYDYEQRTNQGKKIDKTQFKSLRLAINSSHTHSGNMSTATIGVKGELVSEVNVSYQQLWLKPSKGAVNVSLTDRGEINFSITAKRLAGTTQRAKSTARNLSKAFQSLGNITYELNGSGEGGSGKIIIKNLDINFSFAKDNIVGYILSQKGEHKDADTGMMYHQSFFDANGNGIYDADKTLKP